MTNNSDWFAKRLGQTPSTTGSTNINIPAPPSQLPLAPMPIFQQNNPNIARLAPSSVNTDVCPECGSGNYMSPAQQIGKRCYDCGYPISQSGSKYGSLSTARVEGGVAQAQGNNAINNFNPQTIIGRIE